MFWIAHGDMHGNRQLHPRATGLGLAAALLAELVLVRHIEVAEGVVTVLNLAVPADVLAHATLEQIVAEPRVRDVRSWLAYLAQDAEQAVGQRLERAGLAYRQAPRWRRSAPRWLPHDGLTAIRPSTRLYVALSRNEQLTVHDATLAGLVAALGLTRTVLFDTGDHGAAQRRLAAWVSSLPLPLHELVDHTAAAIGALALTRRA